MPSSRHAADWKARPRLQKGAALRMLWACSSFLLQHAGARGQGVIDSVALRSSSAELPAGQTGGHRPPPHRRSRSQPKTAADGATAHVASLSSRWSEVLALARVTATPSRLTGGSWQKSPT